MPLEDLSIVESGAPPAESARSRTPIHDQLVESLRDLIIEGELAGGSRLSERLLCARFGVSRTPLREAFKVLAAEGLVELLPNRGARVVRLTGETVKETMQVIGTLEAMAGDLACRRITEAELAEIRALHYQMLVHKERRDILAYFKANQAIHLAIVAASGNTILARTYAWLSARVRRARYAANLDSARWNDAVAEHEGILRALEARDAGRLPGLLRSHLDNRRYALSVERPEETDGTRQERHLASR